MTDVRTLKRVPTHRQFQFVFFMGLAGVASFLFTLIFGGPITICAALLLKPTGLVLFTGWLVTMALPLTFVSIVLWRRDLRDWREKLNLQAAMTVGCMIGTALPIGYLRMIVH